MTIYFLSFLSLIICIGIAFQFALTKFDNMRYGPLGKLVDVGGYKLHIYKSGINSENTLKPTVILDIGIGGNLLYWNRVQEEIAKFGQVVSYDRAGLGWSEKSPKERTSENIIEELHTLLQKADIRGPYILVGHSFAGINARIFANKYPDEVVGVILVDSSHEDQLNLLPKSKDLLSKMMLNKYTQPILQIFTMIGGARIYNNFDQDKKLPLNIEDMLIALNSTNKFVDTLIKEVSQFQENLAYTKETRQNLKDIPLTVITAGIKPNPKLCAKYGLNDASCQNAYNIWQNLQKDLLTKSTKSRQIIAQNSGHNIPVDDPEVIVKAVKEMLSMSM